MARIGTGGNLPRRQVPFLLGLGASARHDRCEAASRHPLRRAALVALHFGIVVGVFVAVYISWRVNAIFRSDLRHGSCSLPTGDGACLYIRGRWKQKKFRNKRQEKMGDGSVKWKILLLESLMYL